MLIEQFLPKSFKWDDIPSEKVNGETGFASIKTQLFGSIKIRQVVYSKNYLADHWCNKGHIVYILAGELIIEHQIKTPIILTKEMTYLVGDNSEPHKAKTTTGATVIIID